MSVSNVSSSYLASALLPAVRQAQTQLATLEVESSTGQYADLGLQLGTQSGYELSLRAQDDLLQALTTANGITQTNMSTSQTTLSAILSSADDSAASLLTYASTNNSSASLQSLGQSQLGQLIALGNTTSSGSYVFAGANSSVAPLNDFFSTPTSNAKSAIDSAFQSYFGFSVGAPQVGGITATQMQGFLSGPFADQFQDPNWGSNWSNAADTNVTSEISPGNRIATSTNTNTDGFRQLAQGYAMLSEFGGIGLNASAEQSLARTASNTVARGASAIIQTQAQLGEAQTQVTQASDNMKSQMSLLQSQISRTDSVDPAQVATELTTLTTQLQSAYQLTAKINSLSLAQYL
ncbi:MAG: flagellar hook-associated family protein [Pseudomonadota bacterium]|nr:flagellar hook-associated family protein [Pseudomonadota bacterium]